MEIGVIIIKYFMIRPELKPSYNYIYIEV